MANNNINNSNAGISSDDFTFINGTTTTTSGTFTINSFGETTIESFEFRQTDDGNFIEVVKRQKPNPNFFVAIWPPHESPDRIFKEIYGVMTNDQGIRELQLIKTIEGKVTPGHYIDESIEFDD